MSSTHEATPAADQGGDVTITRDFDAPRELIFSIFMNPEQFARIWGPPGTHTPVETVVIEPRAGGRLEAVMVADDGSGQFATRAEFVDFVEPELFSFRDKDFGMLSTSTLIDLGNGRTRLVIRQTDVMPMHRAPESLEGFNGSLDKMARLLGDLQSKAPVYSPPAIVTTSIEGIRITRTFAASREQVFAVWTTAEHFAQWFGGSSVQVPANRMSYEAVEGQRWHAVMLLPDGNEMAWHGTFQEVVPPERLAFTLSDRDTGEYEACVVTLTEVDGGTRMDFVQPGHHMTAKQYSGAGQGWNGFFDVMEQLV